MLAALAFTHVNASLDANMFQMSEYTAQETASALSTSTQSTWVARSGRRMSLKRDAGSPMANRSIPWSVNPACFADTYSWISQLCPLARHSNLPELQAFVKLFRPKRVVPNTLVPALHNLDYQAIPALFKECISSTANTEDEAPKADLDALLKQGQSADVQDATFTNFVGNDTQDIALRWAEEGRFVKRLAFLRPHLSGEAREAIDDVLLPPKATFRIAGSRSALSARLPRALQIRATAVEGESQEETQGHDGLGRMQDLLFTDDPERKEMWASSQPEQDDELEENTAVIEQAGLSSTEPGHVAVPPYLPPTPSSSTCHRITKSFARTASSSSRMEEMLSVPVPTSPLAVAPAIVGSTSNAKSKIPPQPVRKGKGRALSSSSLGVHSVPTPSSPIHTKPTFRPALMLPTPISLAKKRLYRELDEGDECSSSEPPISTPVPFYDLTKMPSPSSRVNRVRLALRKESRTERGRKMAIAEPLQVTSRLTKSPSDHKPALSVAASLSPSSALTERQRRRIEEDAVRLAYINKLRVAQGKSPLSSFVGQRLPPSSLPLPNGKEALSRTMSERSLAISARMRAEPSWRPSLSCLESQVRE
jgi:hypothetical protein